MCLGSPIGWGGINSICTNPEDVIDFYCLTWNVDCIRCVEQDLWSLPVIIFLCIPDAVFGIVYFVLMQGSKARKWRVIVRNLPFKVLDVVLLTNYVFSTSYFLEHHVIQELNAGYSQWDKRNI